MADPQGASAPDAANPPVAQFAIERIYVKDLSLENPGAPKSFQTSESPTMEVGLRMRYSTIDTDVYESVLTLTVTAKVGEATLFLIEAAQAGIFTIKGVPPDQLQPVISIHCPTVLFPYAREAIADAIGRAGYPPLHLAPINFEALYAQQLAQMQAQPAAATVN